MISPWAALGGPDSVDAAPVLPAPVGQRYVVLRIEVESSAESGAVFSITDDGCGAATARLLVDEMPVSPVGCVSSPPNIFEPFAGGRLALEPARPTAVVTLAFVVAEAVSAAALMLDGRLVDRLVLPPVSLVEPERIEGAWHKLPGQRLSRRYTDDLPDVICAGGHGAVFVRRLSPTTWMFDFPFTDVVSSPGTVSDSGTMVEATLELSGVERRLRARPIQAGDLLVLYLGDAPAERVAYRRAGR